MYAEDYQQSPMQQNGYSQNPQDYENEEYETEYESDNQFQPETIINPDLSMNGPPTMRAVTPGNTTNYGFGQPRPHYDPHFEWNYDNKSMTEDEKNKLKLHQGSVCQFPEKNPNPNYKNELAEYSHVDEASRYMIPKSTVCQFDKKNPNPNYKNELAEYSHVDEATKYMIQKPTVAQFQKKVPDFNHLKGLPQKPHLPDEAIYNKKETHNLLQLHQGSVLQQPKHGDYEHVRKYMAYRPKPDSLREEMPVARIPNRILLPSQVKKMQTYITHPPSKTIKSIGFTSSAPSSPTLGRHNIWPPTESSVKQLPRTGFNPNVMYQEENTRKHVWPPVGSNKFGSMNDVSAQGPIPTIGQGPTSGIWNPDPNGHRSNVSYQRFNPKQKLQAAWPPKSGSMINLSNSGPETFRRPEGTDDNYIRHAIKTSVPLTYRCPPNTQFYNVPYAIVDAQNDENNNQLLLNQKYYDDQQEKQRMNANHYSIDNQNNVDENYYDSEQQFNDSEQFQQQSYSQPLQQSPQPPQQQLKQPIVHRDGMSNSPSPIHFDTTQNVPFNAQQQTDLFAQQQMQQQQMREFERQQAERVRNQQRSHHLPKQPVRNNLNTNTINNQQQYQQMDDEYVQQQFISQPSSQPARAKSPVYRPVSPMNIYQRNQNVGHEMNNNQQMNSIQSGSMNAPTQIITHYSQPTVIKQSHEEQTFKTQVEMEKQYYVQPQ